jgi:hypothetical protein
LDEFLGARIHVPLFFILSDFYRLHGHIKDTVQAETYGSNRAYIFINAASEENTVVYIHQQLLRVIKLLKLLFSET